MGCEVEAHYIPTWIGYCCREWDMAYIAPPGRCGLCGERPSYLRPGEPLHLSHPHNEVHQ